MNGLKKIYFKDFVKLQRGFDLPKGKRIDGNFPVVSSTKIDGIHNVCKVKSPGVVTGRSGSLGVVQYVKKDFWPLNTTLFIKDFKRNYPRYVYYFLQTMNLQNFNSGAGVPTLNRNHLDMYEVDIHNFWEQRKIASILSNYDDLIENNTRRIEILEEMAKLVYEEWFIKFRFPGHENVKMITSELGEIPEGWKVKKLEEIAGVNELSIKNGEEPQEINYIDISSVTTGKINEIKCISFADAPSRARRIVKHGDIIWSTVRPNRKSFSIILNPLPNLITSTGFAVITAKNTPYTYLYHALTADDFVGYLTNNATGAAYPAVNTNDFKNANVLVPPNDLLNQFNNIVSDIFDLKQDLLDKNHNLRKTRDLLLPKLISGEIDVSDLNIRIRNENQVS